MPRHPQLKATAKEVQKARAEWYQFHYEARQRVRAMNPQQLESYQYAASMITSPEMTIFGGVAHDWPERKAYELAGSYRLDMNLINPWYVSEAGWEELQRLWKQLPEPIDIFSTPGCVQVGELYTLSTIGAEARPPR